MAETTDQLKMAAQVIPAAIVVFSVFTVMGFTLYFHAKKHTFPKQTIVLLQWLIKVLVYLFAVATLSVSGARFINVLLN